LNAFAALDAGDKKFLARVARVVDASAAIPYTKYSELILVGRSTLPSSFSDSEKVKGGFTRSSPVFVSRKTFHDRNNLQA
jgi:hypothetical protein